MAPLRTIYVPVGYEDKPGQLVTNFIRNYSLAEVKAVLRYNRLRPGNKKSESMAIFAVFLSGLPLKRSIISRAEELDQNYASELLINRARRLGPLEKKNKGNALVRILQAEYPERLMDVEFKIVKNIFTVMLPVMQPSDALHIEEDVKKQRVSVTFREENAGPLTRQGARKAPLPPEHTESVQTASPPPKAPDANEMIGRHSHPSPQECLDGLEAARTASERSLQNYEAMVRKVSELEDELARARQESSTWKARLAEDLATELVWIEISEEAAGV